MIKAECIKDGINNDDDCFPEEFSVLPLKGDFIESMFGKKYIVKEIIYSCHEILSSEALIKIIIDKY